MEYSELVYRLNSVTELVNELMKYKIMIDAIQEIRWQGKNTADTGRYTTCYGSDDKKNYFGTGFLLQKSFKASIIEFEQISEKM